MTFGILEWSVIEMTGLQMCLEYNKNCCISLNSIYVVIIEKQYKRYAIFVLLGLSLWWVILRNMYWDEAFGEEY